MTWDQKQVKITPKEVHEALKGGTPSIFCALGQKDGAELLSVGVVLLRPEQVSIVADRIKAVLQEAVPSSATVPSVGKNFIRDEEQ